MSVFKRPDLQALQTPLWHGARVFRQGEVPFGKADEKAVEDVRDRFPDIAGLRPSRLGDAREVSLFGGGHGIGGADMHPCAVEPKAEQPFPLVGLVEDAR